jgi:hypothetical protein
LCGGIAGEPFDHSKKDEKMDVISYCNKLERQLTEWKAKIYSVIRVVDTLPVHEKEAIYPSIRSLHRMMDEIDGELEQLKSACPADWSPNRQTIEAKMSELHPE